MEYKINFFESIILGIIQGITEFLPVSSSGHLLMARILFDIKDFNLFLEVCLHAGTLCSILIFWRKEILIEIKKILKLDFKFLYNIVIATIPAGIIGLLFKDILENYFFNTSSYDFLIVNYLIMALILYILKSYNIKDGNITLKIAFIIGVGQAFAILPGISRSGITICIACLSGLSLQKSTKFSFFLAIPIMFFATFESVFSNLHIIKDGTLIKPFILGFFTSMITGYIVIKVLVDIILQKKIWIFSIYCFCISLMLLFYNYVI